MIPSIQSFIGLSFNINQMSSVFIVSRTSITLICFISSSSLTPSSTNQGLPSISINAYMFLIRFLTFPDLLLFCIFLFLSLLGIHRCGKISLGLSDLLLSVRIRDIRNYVLNIYGLGWEKDVDFETVEDIARIALAKLEAAPLVDEIP